MYYEHTCVSYCRMENVDVNKLFYMHTPLKFYLFLVKATPSPGDPGGEIWHQYILIRLIDCNIFERRCPNPRESAWTTWKRGTPNILGMWLTTWSEGWDWASVHSALCQGWWLPEDIRQLFFFNVNLFPSQLTSSLNKSKNLEKLQVKRWERNRKHKWIKYKLKIQFVSIHWHLRTSNRSLCILNSALHIP